MYARTNHSLIEKYGTFTQKEIEIGAPGALDQIDPTFLESVFEFRKRHGHSTLISSFLRESGAHGEGRAADQILFEDYLEKPLSAIEMLNWATLWPFTGVGLYFDWAFTNRKTGEVQPTFGLHTDNALTRNRPMRWIAVSFYEGRAVTPLTLPKEQRLQATRIFYYMNPKDGKYYQPGVDKGITLNDALKKYNPVG